MKSILTLLALFTTAHAFAPPQMRPSSPFVAQQPLRMSDEPLDADNIGATEQLLLDFKDRQDSGVVQKYGKTVLNDGLDGVRAVVWGIFDMTNYVFPAMGLLLTMGLMLNMMGYGYFFDSETHGLVIDSLSNMQREAFFQQEVAKLAAEQVSSAL